ncbi:MAG: hypothetical protein WCS42_25695 [Verrucomicrobiota bacterium]
MSSNVKFLWSDGIELEPLIKRMESFAEKFHLQFGGITMGVYRFDPKNPYKLEWRRDGKLVHQYIDKPWKVNPLSNPEFKLLSWHLMGTEKLRYYEDAGWPQPEWFSCIINHWPEEGFPSIKAGKVTRFMLNFDEELDKAGWSSGVDSQEAVVKRAIQRYDQIQELFTLLDCDEVNGYSDSFGEGTCEIFRFAKTGQQILMKHLEERRGRHKYEMDWRVVIDP